MARVRFKARFFVIIIILVLLLAAGLYFLLFSDHEEELALGTLRLDYEAETVIIRDEINVPTEKFDKIIFDVVEGAVVEDGTQIAQVFRWGYQDSSMQSLLDVRKQLLNYQFTKTEGIINTDIDMANAQINQKLSEIRSTVREDTKTDLLSLELQLKDLLGQRITHMRENIQPDETLQQLYQQEEQQVADLGSWKRDIVNNAGTGVVSFYFDGYETVLNANKLDTINAELVSSVIKRADASATAVDAENRPLYRLVNNAHFYVAFLTDASAPLRLAEGVEYTVVFEGYDQHPFTATALAPILNEKRVVNILEFHQDMGELMGIRSVKANILMDATGFEVPLDAVSVVEGIPGIYTLVGEEEIWVPVDVLAW